VFGISFGTHDEHLHRRIRWTNRNRPCLLNRHVSRLTSDHQHGRSPIHAPLATIENALDMVQCRPMSAHAVLATVSNRPRMLSALTKVLADHGANIGYVDIIPLTDHDADLYLEFSVDDGIDEILSELRTVAGVSRVELTPSFSKIYGKRIIIMGGGAQVG